MNIYKISLKSEANIIHIGYAAALNEYVAIKKMGLNDAIIKQYRNELGRDTWEYTASNAPDCIIVAVKL